jgi:hypothetical protein
MTIAYGGWRSPDSEQNGVLLRARYPQAFEAVGELNALGHRLLQRIGSDSAKVRIGEIVGMAMLRRAVAQFAAVQALFSVSLIEPAKVQIRAQFELLLGVRCLVYGGRRRLSGVSTFRRQRETRARYYYVGAERQRLYRRQAILDHRSGRPKMTAQERDGLRNEITAETHRLASNYRTQWRAYGPLRFSPPKPKYYDTLPWFAFGFRNARARVTTIRALAKRFGWTWEYDLVYSPLSSFLHGESVSHDLKIEVGEVELFSPYMAEAFETLCHWSCKFQLLIVTYIAQAYNQVSVPDVQETYRRIRETIESLKVGAPEGYF